MASRGLLGAFEGAGKGFSQVGQMMMADDLETMRQEKLAKIKGGQVEAKQDFEAGEGLLDRESRERIAGMKDGSNGAKGMSLEDRQKAAKGAIKEVMAGNIEYATMDPGKVDEFKTSIYAEYGLNSTGEAAIDRTADLEKEPTDIGLLGSDEGQMALAQSEKEARSKMGLKDYVPFVEPDEENIRKGALKMLGRDGNAVKPDASAGVAPDPVKYNQVKGDFSAYEDGIQEINGHKVEIIGGKAYILKK